MEKHVKYGVKLTKERCNWAIQMHFTMRNGILSCISDFGFVHFVCFK